MATLLALNWTKTVVNSSGDVVLYGTSLLPSAVDTEYSDVFQVPGVGRATRNISIVVSAPTVSGTNLDIALYGSMTNEGLAASGGSALATTDDGKKFLLVDAPVADVTTGTVKGGVVNLVTYPAPFYYLGITTDADEAANTVYVWIFIPAATTG